jgi:hypothetical protein
MSSDLAGRYWPQRRPFGNGSPAAFLANTRDLGQGYQERRGQFSQPCRDGSTRNRSVQPAQLMTKRGETGERLKRQPVSYAISFLQSAI